MQKLLAFLRTLKITYILNNILHLGKLKDNRKLYRKYGLKKPVWAPVSSKDFTGLPGEKPWLDGEDAIDRVNRHPDFQTFSPEIQGKIITWIEKGYLILEGYFDREKVAGINQEVERLIQEKEVAFHPSGRIMFAYRHSPLLKSVVDDPELIWLMSFLLGKPMQTFQSINFIHGSEQRPHSDSIHMTTFPEGYLSAIWIALEDINEENGALVYYPGSHRLPYITNESFEHGGGYFHLGNDANRHYEDKIEDLIRQHQLQPETFVAKPGDLLIWHANLIHGGHPVSKKGSTRRSMVAHYFAEDIICYHELTQRPAILDQ